MNQQLNDYMHKIIVYLSYTALYILLTNLCQPTEAVSNNCVNSRANNIFHLMSFVPAYFAYYRFIYRHV